LKSGSDLLQDRFASTQDVLAVEPQDLHASFGQAAIALCVSFRAPA